jgi:hypothetical protein
MCPPHSDNRGCVAPACNGSAMRVLRGTELRYVLTFHLANQGPATVAELIEGLRHHGFSVRGRPSKAVSDALRWEMEHGRVHRLGRGRYGPGYIPRSTDHRIHQRVLALRASIVAERWAD